MTESLLKMKREFVRFMSHEIRSPLNVAFAGLELLKEEMITAGLSNSLIDLLDEIYISSATAIEILNDMLQYEHIDSGTFKLEMVIRPLQNVLAGRLGSYKYIAAKKNILLNIEDLAHASEFYSSTTGDPTEADMSLGSSTDLNSIAVLYIDKFRLEQIVRNLVTNAVKFTPEGGTITIRLLRTTVGVESLTLCDQPISQLDDPTVNKVFTECLRIEVVDNGAGYQI